MIKRHVTSAATLVAILIAGAANAQTDRAADKAVVENTIKEFVTDFKTNDDKKVATYYHDPMMRIALGKVSSTAETEKWIAEFRSTLPNDYAKFNVKQLLSKMLGKDVAMVSYLGERLDKDGKVLQTAAGSFFLKRTDAGWKIVAGIGYPPEDFIKLD